MEDLNNWQEKFEVCIYAKKLLDKVEYLNNVAHGSQILVDINEIKKGIYYARKYHGSQMRQSGEPFYSHPIEVAYMLAEFLVNEAPTLLNTNILSAALLHDTIEDTNLTQEMVVAIFNEAIASHVVALTRDTQHSKISIEENLNLLYRQKRYDTMLIKIFDRVHNLQTLGAKSPEKIKQTIHETLNSFIWVTVFLEIPNIEQKLLHLCKKYLCTKFKSSNKTKINDDLVWSDDYLLDLIFQNNEHYKKNIFLQGA